MKVAIVGGTGSFGMSLAKRLVAAGYEVVVGSRDAGRAAEAAAQIGAAGATNRDACQDADLVVLATGDLHEYDGAVHDAAAQRVRDLRRSRRLNEVGRVRRGFTASDLVRHPAVTMQELDRIVDRLHDPERLQAWLAYLNQSCLTDTGRCRLQNRWRTARHWSQTPA